MNYFIRALPYLASYFLGCLSTGVLFLWLLLRILRTLPPTLHDRRKSDRPITDVAREPDRKPCITCYGGDRPCVCRRAGRDAEVGGIRYEHLGMTGLEE